MANRFGRRNREKPGFFDIPIPYGQFPIDPFNLYGLPFIIYLQKMLTHALYDLADRPEYVPHLREEIEALVAKDGFQKTTVVKMVKLDSFLKESLRIHCDTGDIVSRSSQFSCHLSTGDEAFHILKWNYSSPWRNSCVSSTTCTCGYQHLRESRIRWISIYESERTARGGREAPIGQHKYRVSDIRTWRACLVLLIIFVRLSKSWKTLCGPRAQVDTSIYAIEI